jgi:YesN/AraC family two-component response regulator
VEVRTLAMQAAERSTDLEEVPVKDLMRVRGKKVLLVEDNVELRMQLHRYLSPVFEIFEAPHGKAGLDMALEHQPAFIISDVSMPVMDGIEFCQTVKRHAALSHIPFVLLTSSSSDESQFTGYHAGADVYLTKPIKKRILFQVILNFLDNQEKIRQRILNSNGFLSDEPAANKSDLEFLDKVIHVIEMNIEDPGLDFKIITESLAMSRTVVYNKLKAVTGLGIQEFIKSIRLKKSLTLLSDGKLAINEVAQRVGFSSQSYFNKCFLKQFDQTPKAYMNKTRKMVN